MANSSAMADSDFDPLSDDTEDLPRTFRREKEARAREARERAAQERAAAPSLPMGADEKPRPAPQIFAAADFGPVAATAADAPSPLIPASVRKIDVPFVDLMLFFIKAVFAAVPALILLTAVLWALGATLEAIFPWLIKMKILISFPN